MIPFSTMAGNKGNIVRMKCHNCKDYTRDIQDVDKSLGLNIIFIKTDCPEVQRLFYGQEKSLKALYANV